MLKTKSIDMTAGSIPRAIIGFAVPVLAGNFFQQMYNMVDTAVLGRYVSADALATAAYNYESGILRAYGNSVIPLAFLILTSILNIILDVIFVRVSLLGAAGVALATIISQSCSAVLCWIYIAKRLPEIHIAKEDWKLDWSILRQHIKTGTPVALSQSCLGFSFLVAQAALNSLGSASISAYTAASKMDTLSYMVMGGFAASIATFTAQNYGKKEYGRVRKGVRAGLLLTVAAAILLTAFSCLFGRGFMSLFVGGNEPEIFSMGVQYIRLSALFYLSQCCDFILQQGLVGVGKTIASTLVCVSEIATRIAATHLLVYRLGFFGMIFVSPCCWTVSSLLLILIYRPLMRRAGVIS